MKIIPGFLFPAEKPPVTTNPLLNFNFAKKQEAENLSQNIEVEAPLINFYLPKKQEVERNFVQTEVAKKRKVERTEFKPRVITNQFIDEKKEVDKRTPVTTNLLLAVKPPETANLILAEKPPVMANLLLKKPPVLNLYHAKKQEVEKVAGKQKVERTEFESGVITNQLMAKEEIEKFFKQDMKNIVYQPGVFEPGLVPNLFLDEKEQDVKKQRIEEDAMKLSILRIKFKSRANQFIAKKKEVEKMPLVTNNLHLAEKPPVTTNLLLAEKPHVTTNLLLSEEFAKEKEVAYAHPFVARRKRSYYDCNAFDKWPVAWGPKH